MNDSAAEKTGSQPSLPSQGASRTSSPSGSSTNASENASNAGVVKTRFRDQVRLQWKAVAEGNLTPSTILWMAARASPEMAAFFVRVPCGFNIGLKEFGEIMDVHGNNFKPPPPSIAKCLDRRLPVHHEESGEQCFLDIVNDWGLAVWQYDLSVSPNADDEKQFRACVYLAYMEAGMGMMPEKESFEMKCCNITEVLTTVLGNIRKDLHETAPSSSGQGAASNHSVANRESTASDLTQGATEHPTDKSGNQILDDTPDDVSYYAESEGIKQVVTLPDRLKRMSQPRTVSSPVSPWLLSPETVSNEEIIKARFDKQLEVLGHKKRNRVNKDALDMMMTRASPELARSTEFRDLLALDKRSHHVEDVYEFIHAYACKHKKWL